MQESELNEIKHKLKEYRDFFGGQLNRYDLIDEACNVLDLEKIVDDHYDYISDMASDAKSSLDKFKREIGLY